MSRLLLINGPPRSGKDTLAGLLQENIPRCATLGFAWHLKRATHAAYGLWDIGYDFFEKTKDQPRIEFLGLTPRAAYIAHSERYMKVLHGDSFFSEMFIREVVRRRPKPALWLVPDSGFAREGWHATKHFGAENTLLVRVHRTGRDFRNDSRSYIEPPEGVAVIDVNNAEGNPKSLLGPVLTELRKLGVVGCSE